MGIYSVPRLPRSITHRPRVSALLDSGAPLTIVRGTAGCGKTTAVADWAERELPDAVRGAWFTVTPTTAERGVFWDALLQQLDDAGLLPPTGVLRSLLGELDAPSDLLRTLIRGFSQLDDDLVVIIDDLHHAHDIVLDDIVAVLSACRRIRVVAVTRKRSTFDLPDRIVALEPTVISTRDLMFTRDEVHELVRMLRLQDDDGSIAETIWNSTGGLPLAARGVLVVATRAPQEVTVETIKQHIAAVGAETLGDMWRSLTDHDPEVNTLLKLSLAEVLTPALAATLTGSDDPARLLGIIEGAGLGWWTSGDDSAVFSFSPEVREGMRREVARRFPDEVPRLRRAVMRWSLDNGREVEAFRQAVALRDWAFTNEILLRGYWKLLPHRALVVTTIATVPKRTLAKQPLLAVLYAMLLNADGARVRALEASAIAVVASRTVSATVDPALRVLLAVIEAGALRMTGRFSRSLKAARRAASLYEQLTLEQRESLAGVHGTVLVHTGLSFFYAGEPERAHEFFLAAQEATHPLARLQGISLTAGSFALQGHMPEALSSAASLEAENWPVHQVEGYPGAMYQFARGLLALEGGDYDEAIARVDSLAPHLETIEHWPLLMYLRAIAEMGRGNALSAATQLEMALHRGARPSVAEGTRMLLDATLANLHMAAGHAARAEASLAKHPSGLLATRARLQLVLGNPVEAERLLRGDHPSTPRLLAEHLLLLAAARLRLGRTDEAATVAERAFATLHDRRLTSPFRLMPVTDAVALVELVNTADRLSGLRPFMRELVAAPGFMPAAPPAVQLTERELVVLRQLVTPASLSEVAAGLYVSPNTVKSQVKSVYKKLGVSSREQAVAEAGRLHLLDG